MAADGSQQTPLGTEVFYARWSPDGTSVAVIRGRWPASEVILFTPGGASEKVLLGQ